MYPISPRTKQRCLAILIAAVAVPTSICFSAESDRPNIVMIVSDDQGYVDLGCFGSTEAITPTLDKLAAEGTRLTSFYVSWPACTPSRGSILTGRYPQRNGLYDMIRNDSVNYDHRFTEMEYSVSPEMTIGMDLREVMISQVLQKAGYATGVFGKWDGGRAKRWLPLSRGFDTFYGFANTGVDYFTHERYGVPSMFRGYERVKEEGYATDLFRREAVRFVRDNHEKPFFLYVPFNAPHAASNLDRPGVQAKDEDVARWYPDLDPAAKRTRYLACVTNMDEAIGEILETIDGYGLTRNTFVLFFSDNGGGGRSNGPLRGGKAQMFEGGNRVCAIARYPGRIAPGSQCDEFLTTLEIFPTLTRMAGASLPEDIVYDGFDMAPVLEGKAKSQRTEMFWQRRSDRAARVGNYKWVDSQRGGGLFDLSKDLGEKNDLTDQQPETAAMMRAKFSAWRKAMDDAEPRGPFRDY